MIGIEGTGGEGGIRTLGTGVSPYNGLAKGSFSPPSLVFKDLQSDPMPPSRAQGLSFGSYCAPLCAPQSRYSCWQEIPSTVGGTNSLSVNSERAGEVAVRNDKGKVGDAGDRRK